MNNLTRFLGISLLFSAQAVVAQDLWQYAEHVLNVAGGQVCQTLQFSTGADFNAFEKLSNGQHGCSLGWGSIETPVTRVELNNQSELGLAFALPAANVEAFVAQGALNPWQDGEDLGLGVHLYARHYTLRMGASCAADLSYCNSPTLAIFSTF